MAPLQTRRAFLRDLVSAGAAPLFASSFVLGRAGQAAPSERINVGMIGTGNQGAFHTRVLVGIPEAQVVATCDPVKSRREAARDIADGAYAQARGVGQFRGCQAYRDFRELLAEPGIDAVFIASPEHWHALHAVSAARAGKDIYCEKALTTTIYEGQAIVQAVRRFGRVFQTGTQQRSSAQFRQACELARNGYLGKLHTIEVGDPRGYAGPPVRTETVPEGLDYELWLGPAPWKPYFPERLENLKGWMLCYDYTVGFQSGWGQHEIDIAQWGNGTDHTGPIEVQGRALFPTDGLNDTAMTWHTEFTYANGVRLIFTSDDETPHGIRFIGDRGWVFVNRQGIRAKPDSVLKASLSTNDVRLYRSDHHHKDFLRSVRTRLDPICPVEAGHHANVICNLSDIATRLGRKLQWDPAQEQFVRDREADQMLARAMRPPWHV